ncbi:hypothetical protein K7X08_009910 [Anisodus acutangulus]|uniref:Bifunctional inhibitor/plant lipid transfer protein/seed storage helical domain-containing protein n=1 Tax=Anisodus acutangulus TaxID=402998 RepID=A0A9Q1N677_9SOLA|nr:hypothetical protein K7X08_009910 [Anisodus acutangulus]
MRRGLVMLTFMVAAIVLCSHRPAMAEQLQQVEAALTLSKPSENESCMKFLLCVKNPSSSCITECCDSFNNFKAPPLTKCICWTIAERMDNKTLTALQKYCAFNKPPCPHKQEINQQEVAETSEAIVNINSSSKQQVQEVSTCCAKDKEKIKSCMFTTPSIDQCCPTFNAMLGLNCDCYNYAMDLDNQVLITLESYCDVTNPCKTAQVM